MTRASNERLSLASADTDAVQATFSGFSFPLDAGGNEEGRREREREGKREDDGMRRPRHVFAGACRNFPFRKSTSEGRLLQRHVPRVHEALTPGIYPPK